MGISFNKKYFVITGYLEKNSKYFGTYFDYDYISFNRVIAKKRFYGKIWSKFPQLLFKQYY